MLRTTIRRLTGSMAISHAFTHGLGTTLDFWVIQAFGAVAAFTVGYRTQVCAAPGAQEIHAYNSHQTNCTVDIVAGVYQGHLY